MTLSDSTIICAGASHAAVPLDILERLSIPQDRSRELLEAVGAAARHGGFRSELVILSTCNRTEIYAVADPRSPSEGAPAFAGVPEAAVACLERVSGMGRAELSPLLYRHEGGAAEEHLYRVIAGLDSLVTGETQIIGQVSRAYSAAQRAGTAGPRLSLLFESAIRASRRTRVRGSRAAGDTSAASMAVRRAEEYAGDLADARVLVVGTGEMGRLVVQVLREKRAGRVDVMTRNPERAAALSERWNLPVCLPSDLPRLLTAADVVVSSTSSEAPLITASMLAHAMRARGGRRLVLVDLAVPRTIEKSAAGLEGVVLLDIESLRPSVGVVREDDPAVSAIIRDELALLELRMAEMTLRPVIGDMWRKAERYREEVLHRTRARLPQVDDEAWTHVERLARALVNKILHDPATRLRAQASNGHAREYAEALRHLFALPERTETRAP